jgi:hypothetical protein
MDCFASLAMTRIVRTQTKKAALSDRLFHFIAVARQLLPPITARTVLSGPKSSAPST